MKHAIFRKPYISRGFHVYAWTSRFSSARHSFSRARRGGVDAMEVRGCVASTPARPKQALDYLLQSDSVRTNPYLRRFVEEEDELVSEFQHNPAFDRWRRKASFKKELTEAYGALARIESRCLPRRSDKGEGLAFVDLCAGRGMLSIVLARRFRGGDTHDRQRRQDQARPPREPPNGRLASSRPSLRRRRGRRVERHGAKRNLRRCRRAPLRRPFQESRTAVA